MWRRSVLALAGGGVCARVLPMPSVARAQSQRVLRFIPQADLAVLDPVWTSVYVTRNHAFTVYDTLYGQDSAFRAQPQMVEGAVTDSDGRLWTLRLREGLLFHDNTPVLARDCVASIRRWGRRDAFGQSLLAATDELSAPDDRTIVFRLRKPFPLLPDALGKVSTNMLPIMPERLASTDPFRPVTEVVGSGPFRFVADERVPGSRVVYERFAGYRPRPDGVADWTAGPKVAHFDRIESTVIPDPATAAAAMQRGEADWWEQPVFDLMPIMDRDPKLTSFVLDSTGNIGVLRMNQLHPPFDNPAIRRAVLGALRQEDFMTAIVGDNRRAWRDGVGFLSPGMPMSSDAGLDQLRGPRDFGRAKQAVQEAGYKGEKVVLLNASDYPRMSALGNVGADLLRRCGLNVDMQDVDWGTVIQRRASKAPPERSGWSVFFTTFTGLDLSSPATSLPLRGNGADSWFGWPTAPRLETLRDAWMASPDVANQRRIAAELQAQAAEDVPFLPLGQFFQPTVMSRSLTGALRGLPLFWNIRRA